MTTHLVAVIILKWIQLFIPLLSFTRVVYTHAYKAARPTIGYFILFLVYYVTFIHDYARCKTKWSSFDCGEDFKLIHMPYQHA